MASVEPLHAIDMATVIIEKKTYLANDLIKNLSLLQACERSDTIVLKTVRLHKRELLELRDLADYRFKASITTTSTLGWQLNILS